MSDDLMSFAAYWTSDKDWYALLKRTVPSDSGEEIPYYDILRKDENGWLFPLALETEPGSDLDWDTLQQIIQNMLDAGCEVIDLDNPAQADLDRLYH
jgi:hypothetical protein